MVLLQILLQPIVKIYLHDRGGGVEGDWGDL
jgi:hypothetical protein